MGERLARHNNGETLGATAQCRGASCVSLPAVTAAAFDVYICRACGLLYDESKGDEDSGLAPGTALQIFRMIGHARFAA